MADMTDGQDAAAVTFGSYPQPNFDLIQSLRGVNLQHLVHLITCAHRRDSATLRARAGVEALPPRSEVRTAPRSTTPATALSILLAIPRSPSHSTIILAASMAASGLTLFCPAYLGGEPCVGSKTAYFSPILPL